MVRFADQLHDGARSRVDRCARTFAGQMGAQCRRLCDVRGLCGPHLPAVLRPGARRIEKHIIRSFSPRRRCRSSIASIFSPNWRSAVSADSSMSRFSPGKRARRRAISGAPSLSLHRSSPSCSFSGPVRCSHSSATIRSISSGRCRKPFAWVCIFPIAGAIASIAIILMTVRTIAATSVHVTGSSRLPMVAGWDGLLPGWFSRCIRSQNPGQLDLFRRRGYPGDCIASQIGAGIQEAFQLVDNAANVFYGIVYFMMFAIPIFGAAAIRSGAPLWFASRRPRRCCLVFRYFFHGLSDHRCAEPVVFGAKIVAVTVVANAIGVAIYLAGKKRQRGFKPSVLAQSTHANIPAARSRQARNDLGHVVGMERTQFCLKRECRSRSSLKKTRVSSPDSILPCQR